MDQTVEKIIYHTKDTFPTILARSEIVQQEAVTLTPMQAAIDRTQRKTLDIAEAALTASETPDKTSEKLARLIKSSVDPASTDSVAAYHKLIAEEQQSYDASVTDEAVSSAIDDGSMEDEDDEEEEEEEDERAVILKVMTIALQEHARTIEQAIATCFDKTIDLKSKLRDDFEGTFTSELYSLYPSGQWKNESTAWKDPEVARSAPDDALAQAEAQVADEQTDVETDTEAEKRPRLGKRRRSSTLRQRLSFLNLGKKQLG